MIGSLGVLKGQSYAYAAVLVTALANEKAEKHNISAIMSFTISRSHSLT